MPGSTADPGAWWVEVDVRFPAFDKLVRADWEEAVPLELVMTGDATWTITRPLATGEIARYPMDEPFEALNAHAADGWLLVSGAPDGASLAVSTHAPFRSAPGFLPLRLVRDEAGTLELRLAPFGALWGDLPDHRSGSTLGTGLAEVAARLTASQLKPSAPAWDGARLCFLLRLEPGALDGDREPLDGARDGVLIIDGARRVVGRTGCFE